jgi:hypothetical protein
VYFSGGGGGSRGGTDRDSAGAGVGGIGGGGTGGGDRTATNGSANTGGGGGGTEYTGKSGGSGLVILRFSGPSPTVSAGLTHSEVSYNGETILLFTAGTGTVTW